MRRIEIVSAADWRDRLEKPWRDLFARSTFPTPFQSFEWMSTWQEALAPRARMHHLTVWEGEDLVGLWPLVRKGSLIRSMGVGPSDYLHPLIDKDLSNEAWTDLLGCIEDQPRLNWDLHQLRASVYAPPIDRPWSQRDQATCLTLDLPASAELYWKSIGKSLRYDARLARPEAMRDRGLGFIDAAESNAQSVLDAFFDLHAARWRKRGLPGAFFGKLKRFHAVWAPKALAANALQLRLLALDGVPIGAIYAMRAGSTTFFYQAGMDPAHKALSPGTILVASLIERSIDDGCERFDFMRGDEPYKRRWKPQHVETNVRLVKPAVGWRGEWTQRSIAFRADVEDKVRARFEGKGLAPTKPKRGASTS